MTLSESPIPTLAEVAERNHDAIVTAVADQCHERIDTLRIDIQRSFFSDHDSSPSFWVQNARGAYGVNGILNEHGALTHITVTLIQPIADVPHTHAPTESSTGA